MQVKPESFLGGTGCKMFVIDGRNMEAVFKGCMWHGNYVNPALKLDHQAVVLQLIDLLETPWFLQR